MQGSAGGLVVALLLIAGTARADFELKFSGMISADIRYRVAGVEPRDPPYPSQWQILKQGWSRNEDRVRAALSARFGRKVKAVADVEMVAYGFSDLKDLDSTTLRERVDPYYFEFNAAYIDINNALPGLDLRIGRQIVSWGAADKFNPVSNLNTLDLSDPLLFGRALANNMVRIDYSPLADLLFTGVVVPVYRAAQLPRTAPIGLLDPLRPAPVADPKLLAALDASTLLLGPSLSVNASALQPPISIGNTQIGLRAAYKVLGQDVALSYYHGRFGIPVPAWSVVTQDAGKPVANVGVVYPQVDILGAELAGSIEKLRGVGYWVEAGLNFPRPIEMGIYDDYFNPSKTLEQVEYRQFGDMYRPAFVPLGVRTMQPVVVQSTPFVKATIGADYTVAGVLYLNLQYVHGFIDEFGAGRAGRPRRDPTDPLEVPRMESRIGDYLVGGADLKVFRDRLLLRLFAVIKVPSYDLESRQWDDYAPTGVIFPQLVWSVWDGTDLSVGGFVMLGDRSTKFGDPAAGGTEVFAKARFAW